MNKIKPKHNVKENLFQYELVDQLMVFFLFCFLLFPSSSHAELKSLSDTELKSSTAQAGFTDFSMTNSTARLFLDIHIDTFAEIDSLSSGWYNNGSGVGWDQKWDNIKVGNSTEDSLTADGFVFIADFDDISSARPVLNRIVIGSNRLQGSLTADMSSFSGIYNDSLIGGLGSPISVSRVALNKNKETTTFNFNSDGSQTSDMGLFFILNLGQDGATPGIQVVAGYDETPLHDPNFGTGSWWDSP